MKRFLLAAALLGSVAGNVFLLRDFFRDSPTAPATAVAVPALAPPSTVASDPVAHIDRRTWEHFIVGGDPADLVARLRAKGFPPKMVRTIVTRRLHEGFAERAKAINESFLSQPYWRSMPSGTMSTPEFNLANRALSREVDEKIGQLLGSQFADMTADELVEWRNQHGEFSPEKIAALESITADYRDLRNQVTATAGRILLPEDREKLAFLDKEMRSDIASALTPAELEDYEMRTGRTGQTLRSLVVAFGPSEQEFRALYKVMQTLDAQFGQTAPQTPEERRQRNQAEAQLGPLIAAALGPERYADYQRTTDSAWRTAHYYVGLNGLPRSGIGPLVAVEKDLAPRASAIRDNSALTPEQRSTQLAALAQEAGQRLTSVLGAERAAEHQKDSSWMRAIQPPPGR